MDPHIPFKARLLATLAITAGTAASWAQPLDLAQSPPATMEPFVAPNVILSLDDSGSMGWQLANNSRGADIENPTNGIWPANTNRASVLKHALRTVFNDQQLLPDKRIRLAWQVMNGVSGPTSLSANNAMQFLDQSHRTEFLKFVRNFKVSGGTSTHDLMERADSYMRKPLGINSPWAAVPGARAEPYLGCRRNYHILLTDGGWNGVERSTQPRNYDGGNRTLPDGVRYRADNPQTRLYRDSEDYTTVADWAFKSWADPLQPATSLQGRVTPSTEFRNAQAETFTSTANNSASISLDPYWNPRHNPATWPHMVTFTIGFSYQALPLFNYLTDNSNQKKPLTPTAMVPYTNDGDLADYALGNYAWRAFSRDRGHDMWHAALNGRGQFYAVNRSEDLATAFRQIVQQINTETEPDRSSAATSGSALTRNAVGLYTAHYDPLRAWSGNVTGQTVATDGSTSAAAGWQGSTASHIDGLSDDQVLSNRTILAWNEDTRRGVAFQWNAIGQVQQAHLNRRADGTADARGAGRLGYLRGVRSMEGTASPPSYLATRPFRQRQSRQGDIINSAIWYTGAPSGMFPTQDYRDFAKARKDRVPMLYVGGNDGMLHGFSARDGTERLAYVPRGVVPGLTQLTDPGYDQRHRYFVDGSPMTGDVKDGSQWKTLLVGTLGAGGKGYFVLDATDPGSFREANAPTLVLTDRTMHASETRPADCSLLPDAQARDTCEADKDLGHVFSAPVLDDSDPQRSSQITRLNNGRWAVVLGNGYNSQAGRAVLLVQYLDGNRELLRLRTPDGAPGNGLSAPRLVDINGDGRPDVAYAGDLQGRLWKFLIASDDPAQWGVAFDGQPLFQATADFSEPSITAPPTVRANDRKQVMKNTAGQDETLAVGGMMVAFGTGRNVTVRDPDSWDSGTLYSVLDNTRYKLVEGGRVQPCLSTSDTSCKLRNDQVPRPVEAGQLIELAQGQDAVTGTRVSADRTFWKVSGAQLDWARHKGWRFKLPEEGERLLKPMTFFDGSNILAIHSQIPSRTSDGTPTDTMETCEATTVDGERQFLTLLNIMDGKPPSVQLMDANGDNAYSAADQGVHRMTTSKGAQSQFVLGERILFKGGDGQQDQLARMPEQPARPSWRQLQ